MNQTPTLRQVQGEWINQRFLSLLFTLLFLFAIHVVSAETLKDPTQAPSASGIINNNSSNSPALTGPVLQSIMIGPKYRAAIISGKKVMLFGKYENATLIQVNDKEVVLLNADKTTQTLDMAYINVKKIRPANKKDEQYKY